MYVAVIDCSALDALARFLAVLGREDLRISSEQGNPARLVQRRTGSNDVVWATIKKMPFPLHNREFVNRLVCCVDVNGDLLFTTVPVDEVIDYGLKTNTVRGVARNIMRFIHAGVSHCKVTYHMHLDAGGRIPTFVVNSNIPLALSAVGDLRDAFQRDDEIDKLERDQLARVVKDEPQTYTAEEDVLVNKANIKLGMLEWECFEELQSLDHLVKMGKNHDEGDGRMIIRASATIDSSIEECAAWDTHKMSRENTKGSTNLVRTLVRDNGHSAVFHFVKEFHIPGFAPREWVLRVLWKKLAADTVVVCYESIDGQNVANNKYVRASNSVYNEYRQLEPLGGVPQTGVTWTQSFEMGGSIPRQIVAAGAPKQLMHLSKMRQQFDKSLEIDGATRVQNVGLIADHTEQYSEEENAVLEEGEKHFADFKGMKAKSLEMASPLATGEIAFENKGGQAWGRATTTVRASPEEVLAFLWDYMRRSARKEDDLEKSVEEQVNGHSMLCYKKIRTPKIIRDREVLARCVWKKESDGFVLVTSPEESDARPITDGVVRGKYPSAMRIKRKNDKETTLNFVNHPDAGGRVPSFLMSRYLGSSLALVTGIQEYFQALRRLEEWDADDGRCVGELLCIMTKAEKGESKKAARIRELFKKHLGLREIAEKYEFFQPMMTRVVENKLLRKAGDVKSKLCSVSLKEGETMGKGLAMTLATNQTAEAGVDEWILKFRSLRALDKEEVFFRPMMDVVAKRLLGEVSWGKKTRVVMGAGLSLMDMATDVFVIIGYMKSAETKGYGWSLLWMIAGSMLLQLCTVYMQNRKKPLKLLWEALIVLTGLKPGFDAHAVVSGKEMDVHSAFDPKIELVICKGAEMVCESIPGCLLQLYAILKSGDRSQRAIVSVAVSALTTGFSSATIAFDADVDPSHRKLSPDFYGYVPDDGKRTVIFVCMVLNSALLLLLRSLSAAMLMLAQKRYFVLYMAGDMALYLLQKVARGDFHYWLPVDGVFGLYMSLNLRVVVKTIADFTGVIHFRGPQELGGLYWTVNMILALLASLASVLVYTESGGGKVRERDAWKLVGCLGGGWLITFGLIFLVMKKKFRGTFFSTTTAKQQIMDRFKVDDEAVKASVMKKNKKMWLAIRADVKEWVELNYWRWVEEKPAWFSESWVAKIPADMIPLEAKKKAKDIRDSQRRRSSFLGAKVQPAADWLT